MKLPDDEEIKLVVARGIAADFRAYVERRVKRRRLWGRPEATVADLCRRFRLSQDDVVYCVEHGGAGMVVSDFAYTLPPPDHRDGSKGWGKIILHAYYPQEAPDAPVGKRVVMIVDEVDEK